MGVRTRGRESETPRAVFDDSWLFQDSLGDTAGPRRVAARPFPVSLIGSRRSYWVARELAYLVVRPHRDGVGLLEFHQLDRIVESGRRAAVEASPELFG
jgi:hypothetical protein